MVPKPEEVTGGGVVQQGDPPPPPPATPDERDARIAELIEALEGANKELAAAKKRGEISGASENSVHAVLEEVKALRAELAETKKMFPGSPITTPTGEPTGLSKWLPNW